MKAQQAYRAVRSALSAGVLVRPENCTRCGSADRKGSDGRSIIHAHHHDYSKPLDVEWICAKCHRIETPLPAKPGGKCFGEKNGQSKLTADLVAIIRSSNESGAALGRRLGLGRSTVNEARRGVTWLSARPTQKDQT